MKCIRLAGLGRDRYGIHVSMVDMQIRKSFISDRPLVVLSYPICLFYFKRSHVYTCDHRSPPKILRYTIRQ